MPSPQTNRGHVGTMTLYTDRDRLGIIPVTKEWTALRCTTAHTRESLPIQKLNLNLESGNHSTVAVSLKL